MGLISRHWQSGAPLPLATSLTWWAHRTSGFLPTLLRVRTPGSSVCPATCGRNACPNIAPLLSTMHGCLPTPAFSYCLHKLTLSMFVPADYQSFSTFTYVILAFEFVTNTLSSLMSTYSSPINAKKVNSLNSSDSYVGLWRNYLILCCSTASSSTSMCSSSSTHGSVRCSPPETLASTPDSGYSYDSKVRHWGIQASNSCI